MLWLSLFTFTVTFCLRHFKVARRALTIKDASNAATTVHVLGGFLSFLVIFFQNENYDRFKHAYRELCHANEYIVNVAMAAKAVLEFDAARNVTRYCCAAAAFCIVGLVPRAYNSLTFLPKFIDRYRLLEGAEYKGLQVKGMEGGDRYRELVSWAVMVVHRVEKRRRARRARSIFKVLELARNEVLSARSWTGDHLDARSRRLADPSRRIRSHRTMSNVS